METLVVKPFGGLANRLLALDSAIKLKRSLKPARMKVIWERNRRLNCKFSHLFEIPPELEVHETIGFDKFKLRSYACIYNSFHPNSFKWPWFNFLLGKERWFSRKYYANEIEGILSNTAILNPEVRRSLYISYYQRFYIDGSPFFPFKPTKEISEQVEEQVRQFKARTVGIHIRRNDHSSAIKHSPTSAFISKIEQMSDFKNGQLFLSSDSIEEKEYLKQRYGDRLLTRAISFSREHQKGIIDAVIDIYCLAKTQKILGSQDSTFGQVASELGGVELEVIKV